MTVGFVLDASVAMTWCFKDEATESTTALLLRLENEPAIVPSWWTMEVANVLAMAERRGRIDRKRVAEFVSNIQQLSLEFDDAGHARVFTHFLDLCRMHQLTAYDAMYLDLAQRRGLPLATLDQDLRRAAESLGVLLLGT